MKTVGAKPKYAGISAQPGQIANRSATKTKQDKSLNADGLERNIVAGPSNVPRHHAKADAAPNTASSFAAKISQLYTKNKRAVAAVGMGVLRVPLMITPAYGADAAVAHPEDMALDSVVANEAASENIASEMLFGPPKSGAKALSDGPYANLINKLTHPDLADLKNALADGRVRLLTDLPSPDGSRDVIYGLHDKGAAVPSTAVKISLDADENVLSVNKDKLVNVWAYESDPKSPGGLQPISNKHFILDADGNAKILSGDRIRVVLPKEIATEVDDVTLIDVTKTVPSHFPEYATANADGHFAFAEESPLTGATTAFYGTAKVLEEADRWAGHSIPWGEDGTLVVKPYGSVTNFFNAYYNRADGTVVLGALGSVDAETGKISGFTGTPAGYDKPVENLLLDGAKSRDIVAHEAGHAVLDAIKPGLKHGMGIAYHEGFADMLNFLTVLEDPDVVARVLEETGGDLSKVHEASKMAEVIGHETYKHKHAHGDHDHNHDARDYIRLTKNDVRLEDSNLTRDDNSIPGLGFSPSRDPHHLGQVFSGAGHEAFVAIYNKEVAAGRSPEEAIAHAREAMGTIILRSTRFIGEHQTSMREAVIAMLKVDDMAYGQKYRSELVNAFQNRGLIDANEDVDALINARSDKLPDFVLPTTVTDASDILNHLETYETEYVATLGDDVAAPVTGLIRHNPYVPSFEIVAKEDLTLHSDVTAKDGIRIIRLKYEKEESDFMGKKSIKDYYISTVFNAGGKLIDVHSERAVEHLY